MVTTKNVLASTGSSKKKVMKKLLEKRQGAFLTYPFDTKDGYVPIAEEDYTNIYEPFRFSVNTSHSKLDDMRWNKKGRGKLTGKKKKLVELILATLEHSFPYPLLDEKSSEISPTRYRAEKSSLESVIRNFTNEEVDREFKAQGLVYAEEIEGKGGPEDEPARYKSDISERSLYKSVKSKGWKLI
tara:strand:- start:519 stop:1073 length:555 start_codon:yes stop_codon:yes gene_type:complete